MATIIDSLVVTLGLDSRKFTDEEKNARAAFKKTRDDMKKYGDEFEEGSRRSINAFGRARTEVAGLIATIAGGYGIKQFVGNLIAADAAMGRFARTTGIGAAESAKFEKAVSLAGGGEGSGMSALANLNDQIQTFLAGRGGDIITIYLQMQKEGGKAIDINAKVLDQFIAIAANARAIEAKTPGRGGFFLRQLGINEDTINILIRGDGYMRDILDKAEKLGAAVKKDTDAAEEFLGKWRTLGQLLTGIFRPLESIVAEGVLDPLNKTLENIAKNQKAMDDLAPKDRPALGRERMNNVFGKGIPEAFNQMLDWFGPDDVVINAIFGRPENRALSNLSAIAPSGKTHAVPYAGGAFGGLNFKPLEWDNPGSGASTEINVNGAITINTQATDAQGIANDLRSALESVAAKRRLAIQANSGQE